MRTKFWLKSLKLTDNLEGVDGGSLGNGVGRGGLDSSGSRQGPVARCSERGDEASGPITRR